MQSSERKPEMERLGRARNGEMPRIWKGVEYGKG